MANSQGVPDKMPQAIMSPLKVAENASISYSFYKPNLQTLVCCSNPSIAFLS